MAWDETNLPLFYSVSSIHCPKMLHYERLLPLVIRSQALIALKWLGMKEFCLYSILGIHYIEMLRNEIFLPLVIRSRP